MKRFKIALSVCLLLLFALPVYGQTVYVGRSEINAVKSKVQAGQQPWASAYSAVIKSANSALNMAPRSVVDNGGPAGANFDKHSYGDDKTYDGDGIHDTSANKEDSKAFYAMSGAIQDLGLAYAFTGDDRYARKAIDLLYHWCVNPNTYMRPSTINYAPHTPGGHDHGAITIYSATPPMAFGTSFVLGHPYWSTKGSNAEAKVKQWMVDMHRSAVTNVETANNNFFTRYLETRGTLAALIGNRSDLNKVFDLWKSHIRFSVKPNGRLHREAGRTKGIDYSIYGLEPFARIAMMARHHGVDLWSWEDGQGGTPLRRAYDFLLPYVLDPNMPKKWIDAGFQQIVPVNKEPLSSAYEMAYAIYKKSDYLKVAQMGSRKTWITLMFSQAPAIGSPAPEPAPGAGDLPLVEIKAPSVGTSVTAPTVLNVEAAVVNDNGQIDKVEFFVNETKLGEVTNTPYRCEWKVQAGGSYKLTAKLRDKLGRTSTSDPVTVTATTSKSSSPVPTEGVILYPVADTYVRDGSYATKNFDREALVVKNSTSSYTRESFVRFNLSNVSGSVDRAVLRLYPVSVAGAGHVNAVALVDQHSWSETTLTWNSRPSSGGMLASWTPVEGKPVEVDVTDAVRKALSSGKQLSLRIYAPSKGGGQDIAHYGSKEDNNTSRRPALVLSSSGGNAIEAPEYSGTDGGLIAKVTASSHDGNVPANSIDGSYSTRWSAEGTSQWIQYELKSETTIQKIGIAWHDGNKRTAYFEVKVSLDGSNWKQIFSGSSSGKTDKMEFYQTTTATARFVRIIGKGNSRNKWNSITEVAIGESAAMAALGKNAESMQLETANLAGEESAALPDQFSLDQNYPNPFNPTTTIQYRLPQAATVRLAIYNVAGQLVKVLVNGQQEAGQYRVEWDGRDQAGHSVASGLYLYRIEAGSFTDHRTMMLIK